MEEDSNQLIQFPIYNVNRNRNLYKRRWIVLSIVSLINICNAGIWVSLAPVSDRAAIFYQTDSNAIDLFSSVFFISTLIVGLIAMWVLDRNDRNGLKLGIYCGSVLTAIGISLRALSSADFIVKLLSLSIQKQFLIAIIGQIIAGCAQPFVLFAPTKVAEFWFPVNQRALATTIAGMSNPFGIVLANILSPVIVTDVQSIPLLSMVWSIPSIGIFLLTIILIRSSKPPTPPSNSAEIISSNPYLFGIKELLTQKAYLLLMLYMGCAVGLFSALITIMEQLLKSKGYNDGFSSTCIAIMIVSGLVGSGLVSYIVDKNKNYMTFMKLSIGLTAISINGLFVSLNYSSIEPIISTFCALFGFFGFMSYPLGLELGIECSFPTVPEATSSGLLMISGQLQGIVFIYVTTQSAKQTTSDLYDYKYSLIILSSIVVFISNLFILMFFTDYKRLNCETANTRTQTNSMPINDRFNPIYS